MDLTLAFHLFSLVAFLVLLVLVQKLWAERTASRELWQQFGRTPKAKVVVNWPAAFLDGFCRGLDISYECRGISKGMAPCRIEPRVLVELFYETPINLIRYEGDGAAKPAITISVLKPVQDVADWQRRLAAAFSGQCQVTVKQETATKDFANDI